MTLGRCSDPDPGATNPKRSATIRRTQITEKRGYWTSLLGSLVGVHFGSVVPFKPNEKERIRYDTTITPSRINSPSTMRSFAPQHASVMAVVLLVLAELRTLFHVPQDVWLQADPPLSGRIQFILTTESSHESDHPNNDTAPSAVHEESIPSRDEVTYLYGEEPVLLGLERCAEYRAARDARNISVQDQHLGGIRIAGMYNTGTNAIAQTLLKNLETEQYMPDLTIPEFKERNGWQPNVIWGKHSLLSDKYPNSLIAIERNSILPVVMIRDPYRWMKSICKAEYGVSFHYVMPPRYAEHCPGLVVTPTEGRHTPQKTHKLTVTELKLSNEFDSLADYWSEFNRLYLEADFPRIMVRYEDTIFHTEKVVEALRECVGIPDDKRGFQYHTAAAKKHGHSSDLATALRKYGTEKGRYDGLTADDLQYARKVFNNTLMDTFHYRYAPESYLAPPMEQVWR
jgi:hypothetical protein